MKKTLDGHFKECASRLVACRNKCGLQVPLDQMDVHMSDSCSHRFVDCPQMCGLQVRVANLTYHSESECVNRLCDCENKCVVSENVPLLERVVLKVAAKLMPFHLKYDCPERLVKCSLCVQDVKAKVMSAHEAQYCGKRLVSCQVEVAITFHW